jgi:hypothetical protein
MEETDEYIDWANDNKMELMSDFIEDHLSESAQQDWDDYLLKEFERWKADRKNQ